MMKAIEITTHGGPEVLTYKEVGLPNLKEGEVLVKIHATAVNYIDTLLRAGQMPPSMMPNLPFIPGVEGTGTIENANGTSIPKGSKVAFLGIIGSSTYAEYAAVPAGKLVVLDAHTDLLAAAVLPVNYFTAFHMLKNVAQVKTGKTALIYAASGGVGTALIQLSKLMGLKIVALERRAEKVQNALNMGADLAFNTSDDQWMESIEQSLGKNAIDYVFNPVAGNSLKQDLALLAPLGHIVIFGFLGGLGDINLLEESLQHFGKAPTISFSEIYATFNNDYSTVDEGLKTLYQWLSEGKISPVFETMPLQDVALAHEKIQAGKVKGKLLLLPQSNAENMS